MPPWGRAGPPARSDLLGASVWVLQEWGVQFPCSGLLFWLESCTYLKSRVTGREMERPETDQGDVPSALLHVLPAPAVVLTQGLARAVDRFPVTS